MSWLTGWGYRRSHAIGGAAGAGTGYQIKIIVHYGSGSPSGEDVYCNSHCRSDFGDIRFTDDDEITLLSCWRESKVDGDYAIFHIKVTDSLESAVTIYFYYGKADATYPYLASELAHGDATFILFDDFNDGVYDTSKWTTTSGSPVESGGVLRVSGDDVRSTNLLPAGFRLKCLANGPDASNWQIGARQLDDSEYQVYTRGSGVVYGVTWDAPTYEADTDPIVAGSVLFEQLWYVSGGVGQFVSYYYNGSLIATHSTNPPDLAPYSRFLSYSANPNLDIDWVFIAKYVSPEPAHGAWGSEEEPPAVVGGVYGLKTNLVFTL